MDSLGKIAGAVYHGEILNTALERLRSKVEYTSLPAFLLPELFTLPQLQKTYNVDLGQPIDKAAFARVFPENIQSEECFINVPETTYRAGC